VITALSAANPTRQAPMIRRWFAAVTLVLLTLFGRMPNSRFGFAGRLGRKGRRISKTRAARGSTHEHCTFLFCQGWTQTLRCLQLGRRALGVHALRLSYTLKVRCLSVEPPCGVPHGVTLVSACAPISFQELTERTSAQQTQLKECVKANANAQKSGSDRALVS